MISVPPTGQLLRDLRCEALYSIFVAMSTNWTATRGPWPGSSRVSKMPNSQSPEGPSSRTLVDAESSIELLDRLRGGDQEALDQLIARYLVPLRRWAHGRLPRSVRTMRSE